MFLHLNLRTHPLDMIIDIWLLALRELCV